MSAAPLDTAQTTPPANGTGAQGVSATTAAAKRKGHAPLLGFEALLAMLSAAQGEAAGSVANETAAVGANPGAAAKEKAAAVAKTADDLAPSDAKADTSDPTPAAPGAANPALIVSLPQIAPAAPLPQAVEPSATAGRSGGALMPIQDDSAKTAASKSATARATANSSRDVAVPGPSTPGGFEIAAATPGGQSQAAKPDPSATAQNQTPAAGPQPSAVQATPLPNPGPAAQTTATDAPTRIAAVTTAAEATARVQAAEQAKLSATPSASPATRDRTSTGKPPRADGVQTGAAAGSGAAISAKMAEAVQSQAETDLTVAGPAPDKYDTSLLDAERESQSDTQAPGAEVAASSQATTTPASVIHAEPAQVRALPQTIASLAAQIVKKLDGRSSHFDVALDPVGLGHVNVRVVIGASGKVSAALAFDTPQAAAELRGRAGELRAALEKAGFDLSGGLTFDVAGDRGQGQGSAGQDGHTNPGFRGQAFQSALDTVSAGGSTAFSRSPAAGVDIRI